MPQLSFSSVGSDTLAGPDGFVIPASDCCACGNIRPLRPVNYRGFYSAMCLTCRINLFWLRDLCPWPRSA